MKTWDAIVVGGGIIGVSLALALRRRGLHVLVVERGEPGRESSHAAAGMLADCLGETPAPLHPFATASARMYPEFVAELRDESGIDPDLREQGTLLLGAPGEVENAAAERLTSAQLTQCEPFLAADNLAAARLHERSVDPRALMAAAIKAAKHRGVDFASGAEVTGVIRANSHIEGVTTSKTTYHAATVVNCAGAWAGQISPHHFPTRPVKGQMLSVVGQSVLKHVVRSPEVYLVPRSDGRILIGATVEDAGFNKRTDSETIHRLHQAALRLLPRLAEARILEDWAGLRPGTPDDLPILGATSTPGYFVATGHYRNGILLAPVTAEAMTQVITGTPAYDLSAFSPQRFAETRRLA